MLIRNTETPLYSLTIQEYTDLNRELLKQVLSETLPPPPILEEKLLKKKEVAQRFEVSLVTVDSWSERGILIRHRIGRRCFWKQSEVETALKSVKKYERVYK